MLQRFLPLISFGAMVVAVGAVHGLYSNRWSTSADLNERIRRLESVPAVLGDWHAEVDAEGKIIDRLTEDELRGSGIKGHFYGHYTNGITGESVNLLIVCGRSGPISVHTPDVCYGGSGFEQIGEQVRKDISINREEKRSVWALKFKSPSTLARSQIEVNWAWNGGSGWMAPESPRWTFAGYSSLYKLYVVRELSSLPSAKDQDPSVSFLQTFLPELEKILNPTPQ